MKGRRGHWCWCCGRVRSNESFSGKNHRRHLCRDCARLGADELRYRQAIRDLERTLGFSGFPRRRQRAAFERFLSHPDPRVRTRAHDIATAQEQARLEYRELLAADEAACEAMADVLTGADASVAYGAPASEDEDIPF